MNTHNLFPTPVGIFDLTRGLTKKELQQINKLERRPNMGNTTSANNNILKSSTFTSLRSWLEDCVQEYFKTVVNPKHDVSLRITQSWINYTEKGQFHHKHAHPNSFISGVFYIQTNDNDKIYFFKNGFQQIKFPTNEYNIWNSDSWWLEAVNNRLLLFPSSLEHSVPYVEGDQTRISLSFNTFPIGVIGEEMDLTGLKLEA